MKIISKPILIPVIFMILVFSGMNASAQDFEFTFGRKISLNDVMTGSNHSEPLKWVNVNTYDDTWTVNGDVLICKGLPIGVVRSENQYENFIMIIEWKFMERGGNSGLFAWSNANPAEGRVLPDGVEVQMLELDYFEGRETRIPEEWHEYYVHGHLFGVGGVETLPDNRMGDTNRSNSLENRCYGMGTWNKYVVVAVDGVLKLSVNGKFVNGISQASQKKGYICLESEGAEIHFRNIQLIELPNGITSHDQVAPLL